MAEEMVALVTANFGGIDRIKPLPMPHPRVRAFYYTDEETLAASTEEERAGWDKILVPNYPRHDFNPRLRARYFKHQIHRLDEVLGYRWLMWMDSSIEVRDIDFIAGWADILDQQVAQEDRMMTVPIRANGTVQSEFEYIQGKIDEGDQYFIVRYGQEKMKEQMAWFKEKGFDTSAMLLACTLWMVENNGVVHNAMDTWWDQNIRFGMMDQLSLPIVLSSFGIRPLMFKINVFGEQNPFWTVIPHAAAI